MAQALEAGLGVRAPSQAVPWSWHTLPCPPRSPLESRPGVRSWEEFGKQAVRGL